MSGLICAGDLMIALYGANGVVGGYLPAVNATEMSINAPAPDIKERKSKMRASFAQDLDSVSIPKTHTTTIALDEFSGDTLAMAFSGTKNVLSQSLTPVTAQPITFDGNNWVELGYLNLSAITVKDTGGTITRVLGTDYEINTRLGLIRSLPGGACVTGDTIGFTAGLVSGTSVDGATQSQIDCKLLLDGKNLADGTDITVIVDKATLNSNGKVDFLVA